MSQVETAYASEPMNQIATLCSVHIVGEFQSQDERTQLAEQLRVALDGIITGTAQAMGIQVLSYESRVTEVREGSLLTGIASVLSFIGDVEALVQLPETIKTIQRYIAVKAEIYSKNKVSGQHIKNDVNQSLPEPLPQSFKRLSLVAAHGDTTISVTATSPQTNKAVSISFNISHEQALQIIDLLE